MAKYKFLKNYIRNFQDEFSALNWLTWGGVAIPLALLITSPILYFAAIFAFNIAPNSLFTGIYYLGLSGIAILFAYNNFSNIRFHIADILFISWVSLVTASLFYYGFSAGKKQLIYLVVLVVLPYFCGRLIHPKNISSFLGAFILTSFVGCFLAIMDGIIRPDIVLSWMRPVFFNFNHTTLLVGFLIGGLLVVMFQAFLMPAGSLQRWGNKSFLLWPLFILGLVFLVSRGALLAMVVVMTFCCLTAVRASWSRRIGLFVFVIVMVIISFRLTPQSRVNAARLVYNSFEQQYSNSFEKQLFKEECGPVIKNVNSVDIRLMLWKEAYRMFVENPWLGVGAGQFGKYSCAQSGFPHSSIIQTFSELGVFGGGIYVLFIATSASCFWVAIRQSSQGRLRICSWLILPLWLYYLLIDQMYGNYFMNTAFVVLCGISVSMACHTKKEPRPK